MKWRARKTAIPISVFTIVCFVCPLKHALAKEDLNRPRSSKAQKEALAKLNGLIGDWRGVGRMRRNSSQGAWTEKANWSWEFSDDGPRLKHSAPKGKHIRSCALSWDTKNKSYRMHISLADDTSLEYFGHIEKNQLTLTSMPDASGNTFRIRWTILNSKRALFASQKQTKRGPFVRMYEVGYTRQGTKLVQEVVNGPECVVTGGLGTIPVSFDGKAFYVCCTGCQQVFEKDPRGVVREYEDKQKREPKP